MLLLNLNRSENQDRVSKTLVHEHNAFLGAEPIVMFIVLRRKTGFWSRTPDHGKERASWSPPFWIFRAAKLMCSPDLPFPTPSCLLRDKHWVVHTQGCRAHIALWAYTRAATLCLFFLTSVSSSPFLLPPPLLPHTRASVVLSWSVHGLPVSRTSSLHPTYNLTVIDFRG